MWDLETTDCTQNETQQMLLGNSTISQENLCGAKFKTMKNSELETGQLGTRFFPRFVIKLQL